MFADRFGRQPTVAAFAPGRVNLIGEHTDYNLGFVLPIAIERETIIVADHALDERVSTMVFADLNETMQVDLTRPLQARRGKPGNHPLGVADQFHKRGFALPNLDALVTSSVPIGAGLSSSAAIEVAFALLLANIVGTAISSLETARLCRQAEHAFAGTPCGIMDMYIAAAAKPDRAMLIDCRSEEARHVPADFESHGATLLVVDTGVKHELASSAYADRRATCDATAELLGLPSLRSATIESLNTHGLSNELRRRALHVIAENARTVLAAEALALGDLRGFGERMFQSHASLRDLYEVSCPELDAIVDAAKSLREGDAGVFGARMTGGGFGGCAIVLCAKRAADSVRARVTEIFAERFGRSPHVFATGAGGGAKLLPCSS